MVNLRFILLVATLPIASEASVMCGVFEGSDCSAPLYYMKLCADITLRQAYCDRLCGQQEPICNVEDFAPWVEAYEDIGRKGIRGDLQNYANEFDDAGTILYLSEKKVTACKKTGSGSWAPFKTKTCPKAGVASDSTCLAGTLLDRATNTCIVHVSAGGSGTLDYHNLLNQSGLLVATQNQHFGDNPSTDTKANLAAVTSENIPGLVRETKEYPGSSQSPSDAVTGSFRTAGRKSGVASTNFSETSMGQGGQGISAGTTAVATDGKTPDQAYALADTGSKESYSKVGGSAAKEESIGGVSETSSWFGHSGAATAGGASGEAAYAGKITRSSDVLDIEDPINYFMMSDIGMSLFKRVTAQCRRKEQELATASGL